MKKVKSREKFRVKAETWNSFINAAEFVKQRQADMKSQTGRRDTKSGTVMLRNGTDAILEQFAVVSIGNLIITPTDNEPEFRQSMPVFEALLLSASNKDKPFAVLQKPLAKKECGIALVAGITPVKINVSSESHEYAEASVDEVGRDHFVPCLEKHLRDGSISASRFPNAPLEALNRQEGSNRLGRGRVKVVRRSPRIAIIQVRKFCFYRVFLYNLWVHRGMMKK